MTSYESHRELGMYRKETNITITGAHVIPVSRTIAWNCFADFRNKPTGLDTYTLGFEYVHVTTCNHGGAHAGAYIASNITSVNDDDATLNAATWDTDVVEVGYYARGDGTAFVDQSFKDGDYQRVEHIDGIYRALDQYGNVNPTESGYVFDQSMAYRVMPAITAATTAVEKLGDTTVVGTWSFTNQRPYYVTNVRVEVKASAVSAAMGVELRLYEDGVEMLENGGTTGLLINDQQMWVNKHNDGVDTWYHADVFLGMWLCSDFKATLELYDTQVDIDAGDCCVYVSGWHVPDPVPTYTGLETNWSDYNTPMSVGAYREDIFTASADSAITVGPYIAVWHDAALRTDPHFRGEYRYGIEFVKNLTTDEYVTTYISYMSHTAVSFDAGMVNSGDKLLVGYYAVTIYGDKAYLVGEAGDVLQRGHTDGAIMAANRMDRVDFGKATFPFGVGAFEWHPKLWYHAMYSTGDKTKEGLGLRSNWTTVLNFDVKNYGSRLASSNYKDGQAGTYNETPFFVTGVTVGVDESGVSGAAERPDYIEVKVWLNGVELRQAKETRIRYYPIARASGFDESVSAALAVESGEPNDGAGTLFYIPVGMCRCYSLRVDLRVVGGDAFKEVKYRIAQIEGWIVDDA